MDADPPSIPLTYVARRAGWPPDAAHTLELWDDGVVFRRRWPARPGAARNLFVVAIGLATYVTVSTVVLANVRHSNDTPTAVISRVAFALAAVGLSATALTWRADRCEVIALRHGRLTVDRGRPRWVAGPWVMDAPRRFSVRSDITRRPTNVCAHGPIGSRLTVTDGISADECRWIAAELNAARYPDAPFE